MFTQFQFISFKRVSLFFLKTTLLVQLKYTVTLLIYAIICLKNIYYYFISNAEKFITIMRMWFKIFNN